MATALRACVHYGCQHSAPCPVHTGRKVSLNPYTGQRLSASAEGYGAQWRRFRDWHLSECVRRMVRRAGLCGCRLPGAPVTTDSYCDRHGLVVGANVLDHIVPVTGPNDPRFYDVTNLQWLCDGRTRGVMRGEGCHDVKRQRERHR